MKPLFLVTCLSLLVSFFIAYTYIPKAIVVWDEGTHMNVAFTMFEELRHGEFLSYVRTVLDQTGYPPFMPMVTSSIFLLSGFSIETARRVNLMWFVLSAIFLYLIGIRVGFGKDKNRSGEHIGYTSVFLFLTSPLLIFLHSVYMRESASITMSLLTVLIYFVARDKDTWYYYIATGLVFFALLMTKYSLGIIIALGLTTEAIIYFCITTLANLRLQKKTHHSIFHSFLYLSKEKKHIVHIHLLIFGTSALLFALWMIYPADKIPGFIRTTTDPIQYSTKAANVWGYLLYYPMAIILTYSASSVVGIFLLLFYAASLGFLRDYRIRTCWLIVTINYVLATIHYNNVQERYIATSVPFLFLLSGYSLIYFIKKILRRNKKILIFYALISSLLGLKIIVDLLALPNYIYAVALHTFRTPIFNQIVYEETLFVYDRNRWYKPFPQAGAQKPQDVVDFIIQSVDLSKPVWIDGYANELSPGYFTMMFSLAREKNAYPKSPYGSQVVTIEVLPESKFYTYDYTFQNLWQIPNIRAREKDQSLTKIHEKIFDQLGIRVVIYGK